MFSNSPHSLKAQAPTSVTESGIITSFSFVLEKLNPPIFLSESGNTIPSKLLQL